MHNVFDHIQSALTPPKPTVYFMSFFSSNNPLFEFVLPKYSEVWDHWNVAMIPEATHLRKLTLHP